MGKRVIGKETRKSAAAQSVKEPQNAAPQKGLIPTFFQEMHAFLTEIERRRKFDDAIGRWFTANPERRADFEAFLKR